ncbi:MAG: hypothetical protein ACOVP1_04165 [Bacteroidia bacterium]
MKKTILLFFLLIPLLQLQAQYKLGSSVVTAQLNLQNSYVQINNPALSTIADKEVFSTSGQFGLQYEKVYQNNKMYGIGILVNNANFTKDYTNYLAGLSFSHRNIFPLKEKYGFHVLSNVSCLAGEYISSFFGPKNQSFQMQIGANANAGIYYFLNKNVVFGLNYNLMRFSYSSRKNNEKNSSLYLDSEFENTDFSLSLSNGFSLSNLSLSVQYVFQSKK